MADNQYKRFWEWVNKLREAAGLSWREMEVRSGSGTATLTTRARENLRPTLGNLQAVAEVLRIPIAEVMRQAGILDDADEAEPTLQQLIEFARDLTLEERRRVLQLLQAMYHVPDTASEVS